MRRSASWSALLAGVLLVAGVACGSSESGATARHDAGANVDDADAAEQQASWEHRRGDLMGFAQAISMGPYWMTFDRSIAPDAATMAQGSIAVVRAEVTGLEVGPVITSGFVETLETVSEGLQAEMGPDTPNGFGTVTLAIVAEVVSSDSDSIAAGSTVRILVPIFTGTSDVHAFATEGDVVPLLDHDVVGLEVLVAVEDFEESGAVVPAYGMDAVLMGLPDGSAAVLLSAPSDDGRIWGTSDLKRLESAMRL